MDKIFSLFIACLVLLFALHYGLSFLGYRQAVPNALKRLVKLFFQAIFWPFRLAYQQIRDAIKNRLNNRHSRP